MARAYAELFAAQPFRLTTFPNDEGYDELVLARAIPFRTLCEHHMLLFSGVAHVGYLPGERILGLSKLARLVEHFAAQPQTQERLTMQIAKCLGAPTPVPAPSSSRWPACPPHRDRCSPARGAERFGISGWGLICARQDGARAGGAVIAFNTPGLCMLGGPPGHRHSPGGVNVHLAWLATGWLHSTPSRHPGTGRIGDAGRPPRCHRQASRSHLPA